MRPEIIDFINDIPAVTFVANVRQYPYHWHNTFEIFQVLKGSVNICIGNDDLVLGENDIAIVNIDEIHRIVNGSPDNQVRFIHIDPVYYSSVLPDSRYSFIYCCSAYHEGQVPEKYRILKNHISHLVIELDRKEINYSNVETALRTIVSYIDYNFDFLRWGYGITPFDEKWVERFKKIAEKSISAHEIKQGLKDLAEEVNINYYHLSHDIREKFGNTFQELLYYSKCEYAARLLLGTDERIIDIALECRFSDVKYLIKYFKRLFNCTPSEFRNKYKTDSKALITYI